MNDRVTERHTEVLSLQAKAALENVAATQKKRQVLISLVSLAWLDCYLQPHAISGAPQFWKWL